MKKYFALATVFFALACNSNNDKKAAETVEPEKVNTDSPGRININKEPTKLTDNLTKEDSTTGSGLLSGKFELIDYKKDNVKINLPKTFVKFTKNGDYIKNDGASLFYKIQGDNFILMASKKDIISKSKIEFLNAEKTSFVIKNANEKTEFTYQKVN